MIDLARIGWTPERQQAFDRVASPQDVPARVARRDKAHVLLLTRDGERTASIPPHLRPGNELVTGDWVLAHADPLDADGLLIRAVLPRATAFTRKAAGREERGQVLAANVDVALLVTSLEGAGERRADFNLARVERYLALAHASRAQPIVVLNKVDAAPDAHDFREQVARIAPDAPILLTSALTGEGLEPLRALAAPGHTLALLGSSGVGKTSLANALLGDQGRSTRPVRPGDHKGRHTTTHRELIPLPQGGALLDTPGLRELALWDDDGVGIAATFPDLESLALSCRFRDCRHDTEPGCAIRGALETGQIDERRAENWKKLSQDAARRARTVAEERAEGRDFGRMARRIQAAKEQRRRGRVD